jgi:hypothetical protein
MPPPRLHTVEYSGVLAPPSSWRSRLAPPPPQAADASAKPDRPAHPGTCRRRRGRGVHRDVDQHRGHGDDLSSFGKTALRANPHLRFFNGQRGYLHCRVTPERFTTDFRVLEYVKQPGGPSRRE